MALRAYAWLVREKERGCERFLKACLKVGVYPKRGLWCEEIRWDGGRR
jgi:hypothetical protein